MIQSKKQRTINIFYISSFKLQVVAICLLMFTFSIDAKSSYAVIADSLTHLPLTNASIFNCKGKFIGTSNATGTISCASHSDYPITIRYMGFKEKTISVANPDTIFLEENIFQLQEVTIESKQTKLLHILAYVREYSTLSTYTDTVALFREKMVDFMLPNKNKTSYKGWRDPRILSVKSYYHFTDTHGLDSVSNSYHNLFSWCDWVGILPAIKIPSKLKNIENITDTLTGKYIPTEIWVKDNDKITLDVDALADTTSRKYLPNISWLLSKKNVDFERIRLRLNYNNVSDDYIRPLNLTGYSINIDSRGRWRNMFKFNRYDESFFVTTYAEVYVLDKEFITVKEAKKWENNIHDNSELGIYESPDVPELQPSIQELIARVESIDANQIRLAWTPDKRLVGKPKTKKNFGQSALQRIKSLFGISSIRGKKKQKRNYNEFVKEQMNKNNQEYLTPKQDK